MAKETNKMVTIDNRVIDGLLSTYSVIQLKVLMAVLNRIEVKERLIEKEMLNNDGLVFLDDENYSSDMSYEGRNIIYIKASFIKDNAIKKSLTNNEIETILDEICDIRMNFEQNGNRGKINLVKSVVYYDDTKQFEISYNYSYIKALMQLDSKFTILDLKVLVALSNKYEVGLYLKHMQYNKGKGYIRMPPEQLKVFFNEQGAGVKNIVAKLKKGVESYNKKTNSDLRIKEHKENGNKISYVLISTGDNKKAKK